jgi:preprotein translocase subunit SecA
MRKMERAVYLNVIDTLWMEHIDNMQHLRESVALKGYAQRDPLIEYKEQAYLMFAKLLDAIQHNTVSTIFKINIREQLPESMLRTQRMRNMVTNEDQIEKVTSGEHKFANSSASGNPVIIKANTPSTPSTPEAGRNDPCPCGSGKKYKKCHGTF